MSSLSQIDEMRLNLQLLVKVQSKLGLLLTDAGEQSEGSSSKNKILNPEHECTTETHFLKMEGVLGSADVNKSVRNIT